MRSIKNACIDYLNKLKKEKDSKLEYLSEFASEQQVNFSLMIKDLEHELKSKFAEMMLKLNHKEQAVYVLRDYFNLSYEEVSENVGTKVENARKIFQRAKERMKSDETRFNLDKIEFEKVLPSFLKANFSGQISEYVNKLKNKF